MNDLLAQYRRRDRAVRMGGIAVLLLLIAVLVMPDGPSESVEAPASSQVVGFEPARSQAVDAISAVDRDYDFSLE